MSVFDGPPQTEKIQRRPSWSFVAKTVTGKILLINTCVFVAMCIVDGTVFLPSEEALRYFGAKDSAAILNGEWWRLVTPMFVHVGLIHFGLNSFALFFIGQHIEYQIGRAWFAFIYLASGIVAGAASATFVISMSAGASGAIFGILGVGFVFERLLMREYFTRTGEKLRRGPYTGLVVINVVIGLILTSGPVRVDNAAHLGGLFAGTCLTIAMLRIRPNRFFSQSAMVGYSIILFMVLLSIAGGVAAQSESFIAQRIEWQLLFSKSPQKKYEVYTGAIEAFPEKLIFRFERGKLLLADNQVDSAFEDFDLIVNDREFQVKLNDLAVQLQEEEENLLSLKLQDYLIGKRAYMPLYKQ